jgi:cobalt/nickel transport system permease protein
MPRRPRRSLAARTARGVAHAVSEVLDNEETAARSALLQHVDPRVKLLSLFAFAIVVSLVRSPWVLAGLVALTLALATLSRVGTGAFARKVWGSAGLFALIVAAPATTRFITPGSTLVRLGPVVLTVPGTLAAITLVLRVVAASGFAILVVWTTRWTDLLAALTALKMPDVIVATLAMTQKQVLSLLRTVEQIHLARESRMLSVGRAAEDRRWVVGRIAFVMQKSLKTADDVYDAMLSRGYAGAVRSLSRLKMRPIDGAWLASSAAACALLLALDRLVMPR